MIYTVQCHDKLCTDNCWNCPYAWISIVEDEQYQYDIYKN